MPFIVAHASCSSLGVCLFALVFKSPNRIRNCFLPSLIRTLSNPDADGNIEEKDGDEGDE